MAIPATISPFLTVLLGKASAKPSAGAIRPIYKILSGVGSHLLDALPSNVVAEMQETFKKILHAIREKENTAELFCLAVLALISSEPSPVLSPDSESPPPHTTRSTRSDKHSESRLAARSYFASKRASQTLGIVVLKAAVACSKSCKLSVPQVIESLHLSTVVIQAIDFADRSSWTANDKHASKKLIEKVLACDQQPEIRCAVRSSTAVWNQPLTGGEGPSCYCFFTRRSSAASRVSAYWQDHIPCASRRSTSSRGCYKAICKVTLFK